MRCRNPFLAAAISLALIGGLLAVNGAFCLTSQDVPAADLPTPGASAETAPGPTPSVAPSPADLQPRRGDKEHQEPATDVPDSATEENSDDQGPQAAATSGADSSEPEAAVEAVPPALDAAAVTVGPELGNESLQPEIKKALAPAMTASLRLTESARQKLADGQVDEAMRDLARAISLDPANAFAYYFLGRAYFVRKNYKQAATFFRRAAIGFDARADWTAEALSYEGLCDEELGKTNDAAGAYKQALAAAPDNFRARVGYGRIAVIAPPQESADVPSPDQNLALPPPEAPDEPAPSEPPPPPP